MDLVDDGIAFPSHQEQDGICDFFGLHKDRLVQIRARIADQLRVNTSGTDCVDPDSQVSYFPGKGFGHPHQGMFGRCVSGLIHIPFDTHHGTDINDVRPFLLFEVRNRLATEDERAPGIDTHEVIPDFRGGFHQRSVYAQTRIVDKDVQSAKVAYRIMHQGDCFRFATNVRRKTSCLSAHGLNLFMHEIEFIRRPRGKGYLYTTFCQCASDTAADSTSGARDDGYFSI